MRFKQQLATENTKHETAPLNEKTQKLIPWRMWARDREPSGASPSQPDSVLML